MAILVAIHAIGEENVPRGNFRHRLSLRASAIALAAVGVLALPMATAAAVSTWTIVSSPDANSANNNFLYSATCTPAGDCWAAGRFGNSGGYQQTIIEHNSGSGWALVSSPSSTPTQDNILDGITCIAVNDCWAVGQYNPGLILTLTEHYNGSTWSIVSSPNISSATQNVLTSVACVSANDCWAVGQWNSNGGNFQTLIEHYDGSAWSLVTSPNSNGGDTDFLTGVACTSGGDCWAVGDYYDGTAFHTLIEENSGSGWTIVSSPNTETTEDNLLTGVTCAGGADCWAVGDYYNGNNYQTLILRQSGSSWDMVASPNTNSSQSNLLNAVTCSSAGECVAVGEIVNGTYFTLIEQFTGGKWVVASSPNVTAAQANFLNGVACAGAGDCFAVGEFDGTDRLEHTLIEHSTASNGADLSMNLRAASTATVGHNVTYKLHIANSGPGAASSIRVHFSLPKGTTFVSASANGRLDSNQDSVRWTVPTLASGGKLTLTVTLTMNQVKSMRAFASVYAVTADASLANNISSVLTKVLPAP